MISEGTHDYGRAEAQRAKAHQATVPTLAELMAESDMVTTDAGTTMPAKLAARGDQGWEFDVDRDSEVAARLADLVKDMDATCEEIMRRNPHTHLELRALARRWQAIRRITQGGQS